MQLSIRWKFILSIGLTLLVTYVALLAWDYQWQRDTADLQMQDLVTARAHGLANALNERQSAAARQADSLATAIQNRAPMTAAECEQALRESRPTGNLLVVWRDEPQAEARGVTVWQVTSQFEGGRGGRGGRTGRGQPPGPPGAGGPGPEGGPLPMFQAPPPGRQGEGPGGRFGRLGPRRGGLVSNVDRVENAGQRRDLTDLLSRFTQPEWIAPRSDEDFGPGLFSTYVSPITVGETIRGMVVSRVLVEELGQLRPTPRGRGRGSASAPATQSADPFGADAVTILDNEGRRIWPPAPRRGPQIRERSALEQVRELGRTDVLAAMEDALSGESRVTNVTDIAAIVPNPVAGQAYWVALAPITASGWVVTAAIPESQFMSRIVDRLWQRGLFLIVGLLVLMAVVMLVSIRLTQPIERMAGAVQQLAAGNLDAQVIGVNSRDELGQLAGAFNSMTRQLKQHVAALTEQTAARQSVEAELRIARQIQSDLLPRIFPPFPDRTEFELHAVNVAAKRVAGDFYDFFFAPNGMLTITIADVAGKGMPAALLMAVTRTIIRNLAMEGHSPAQIIERANTLLVQDITNSMFVTLFLLQYDTKSGRIVYVNAGHPHPYRFGINGTPRHFGEVTGAILGVNPNGGDWAFEQREDELGVGETLLLYTDGVTEARAPDDSMLRDSGLEQLIVKHGGETVRAICESFVEEVSQFQHGQQSDDITLLALRRTR